MLKRKFLGELTLKAEKTFTNENVTTVRPQN